MRITDEQLDEFIDIYEKNFGVRPTREYAFESATKLVNLVELLYNHASNKSIMPHKENVIKII